MSNEDDEYGIRDLFANLDFDTPSAGVLRKRSHPLGLLSRDTEDEIPISIEGDSEAVAEWLDSRTTPNIGNGSTIYEDLYEILLSIEPLIKLAKKIPSSVRNDMVLFSLQGQDLCVRDLKRMRNVEMRIRLIRMAIQQLEARANSTTSPGFWKK